jgi:phage shock protein PspC (stress-responsive transcriptional regulator)
MKMRSDNLFTRDDTFLGVCEAIGEDFRISPLLLRLGMTAFLFFNPLAAVATYLGAGILVALSRWIAPNPRAALPAAVEPETMAVEPEPMAIAA